VFRIGTKSNQKIHSTGNKSNFPSTIGNKLTKNNILASHSNQSSNISNHSSNTPNTAFIPTGLNRRH
jgi:hypothetical protein